MTSSPTASPDPTDSASTAALPTSLLSRAVGRARRLAATWRRRAAARRERQAALELDDRLLADIGLTRHQLLELEARASATAARAGHLRRSLQHSPSARETTVSDIYTSTAIWWGARFAVLLFSAAMAAAADAPSNSLVDRVRALNDRFQDVAVAVSEGYAPIACASGADGGAMGVHYVNPRLIAGDVVDIRRPQAVMYEPTPDGRLELIAVEYITSKGPASLQNHLFNFNGAPNRYGLPPFYELHVWAWKANPRGAFADMNPTVSCEHAATH